MSQPYGVMDFSTLKKENQTSGNSAPLEGEVEVREDNLETVITDSQVQLTLMLVTSARVQGGAAFTDDVRAALARYVGSIRLALVDADQQPRVAAALRIQALPAALVLIKGQLQPLFEGVVTKDQLAPVLDNLVEVAKQEGLRTSDLKEAPDQETQPVPAELEEAYTAMEQGELDRARALFSSFADSHPENPEGKRGVATVGLLERTRGADLQAGRAAAADAPGDVQAQLMAADLDILGGHVEDAFARLLTTFRDASDDDERSKVRARLLELFDVVGADDERVSGARKRLSRLMF